MWIFFSNSYFQVFCRLCTLSGKDISFLFFTHIKRTLQHNPKFYFIVAQTLIIFDQLGISNENFCYMVNTWTTQQKISWIYIYITKLYVFRFCHNGTKKQFCEMNNSLIKPWNEMRRSIVTVKPWKWKI